MKGYILNGATLKLEAELCIGCGACLEVCPHAVFALEEGRAMINAREHCMECGACAKNCPSEALKVRAGVGCAVAIFNGRKKRKPSGNDCCCESTDCC